jgi:hypothetical protein
VLNLLPERLASTIWSGFDRLARHRPQDADLIISVWKRPDAP